MVLGSTVLAQTGTFIKTYGGSGEDQGHSVVRCANGDLLVAGMTNTYGAGNFDIHAMRLDPSGNIIWARTFGSSSLEERYVDINENSDSTIIIAASTFGLGASGRDALLIKLNSIGTVIWEKRIGAANAQRSYDVLELRDGNHLLGGIYDALGNNLDLYVAKFDQSGNLMWGRAYGGLQHDYNFQMVEQDDSTIVAVGYVNSFGVAGVGFTAIKLDKNGNLIWTGVWDGSNDELWKSVTQTLDGNLVMAGNTSSWGAGAHDATIVKMDQSGNIVWARAYGTSADDRIAEIRPTADSGFVAVGETSSSLGFGNKDIFLMKVDKNGNLVWSNAIGNANNQLYAMETVEAVLGGGLTVLPGDAGFVITACSDTAVGGREILLCQLDNVGMAGCYTKPIAFSTTSYTPTKLTPAFPTHVVTPVNNVTTSKSSFTPNIHTACVTAGGCGDTANFSVDKMVICAGDSITITNLGAGGNYNWYDNGVSFSNAQNPKWSSVVIGPHVIRLIAGVGQCADTFELTVTRANDLLADAGITPTSLCTGDTIQLGGSPTAVGGNGPVSYNWQPSTFLDNPSVSNPDAFPGATTSYVLTVTDSLGCMASDTVQVIVNMSPIANAGTGTPKCLKDTVTLGGSPAGTGGTGTLTYQWNPNYSLSSNTSANPMSWSDSTITYTLTVTDSLGCSSTDTLHIIVGSKATAVFDSTHTVQGFPVTLNIYSNDQGDPTSIAIFLPPLHGVATTDNSGNLTYTPDSTYVGCDSMYYKICDKVCPNLCDTAKVLICIEVRPELFVPSGYSPNGDGFNDAFMIVGLEFYPENSIQIFNRWGDQVYAANPYVSGDWDGKNHKTGKPVTDGTYYYTLTLTPGSKPIVGPIELRR